MRQGVSMAGPLILIGSFFMLLVSFPIPNWENLLVKLGISSYLWKGVESCFGLVGLVASFGISRSLADQYETNGTAAGIISLAAFSIVTPFVASDKGAAIPLVYLSAQGLFTAIILGLTTGYMYQRLIKRNIVIKLPAAVPPAVATSLSELIPALLIMSFWLIVYAVLDTVNLPSLHELAQIILRKPVGLFANNIIGVIFVLGLNSVFWFAGLHGGNVVTPLLQPLWLANLDANALAFKAGAEKLPHIITASFINNFVFIGGAGATIGLAFVLGYLARKKRVSEQTKNISTGAITSGLFNINEPVLFGIPIVLNFLLVIPFILAPIVNAIITYTVMKLGWVPLTKIVLPWTAPPIISGFLTTGSLSGSILQLILIIVDSLLYLPFYLMIEKQFKEEENNNSK